MSEITDLLVTGATGILGQAILRRLKQHPLRVVALGHNHKPSLARTDWIAETVDITDSAAVAQVIGLFHPQSIIHCAALISYGNSAEERQLAESVNIQGSENLFKAALVNNVQSFVQCSTISVYNPEGRDCDESWQTQPADHYGTTKLAAEQAITRLAVDNHINTTILRYSGLYAVGKKAGAVYQFAEAVLQGRALSVPDSPRQFQFLSIDEAADATILAMVINLRNPLPAGEGRVRGNQHNGSGEIAIFNIAPRETITLRELAKTLNRLAGQSISIETMNRVVAPWPTMSVAKAKQQLQWEAAPLEQSLARFIEELRCQ